MGGKVALTIRTSETEQWRGSCWTNLLPLGLLAPEFYVNLDSGRRHAAAWLGRLLANRLEEPALEQMWGGHGMCAPVGYGIVVVDYVSRSLVSAQGYCSMDSLVLFGGHEVELQAKWDALEASGLLTPSVDPLFAPGGSMATRGWRLASIRLPFEHTRIGQEDSIDQAMADWADRTLGLSDEERACWATWIEEHAG